MSRRSGRWTDTGVLALLYLLWLLTSAEQFRKYFHAEALLFYVAGAFCIALTLALTAWLARKAPQPSWKWLAFFWVILAIVYLTIYPITLRHLFGVGSDSENALVVAATSLLHGHYPYYRRTYLNNLITPMPGSVLLAVPFQLLGRVSYQGLFWMAVFVLFADRFFRLRITALAFLVTTILGNAGILDEFVVGGDYTLNAIYVAIAVWWVVRAHRTRSVWLETFSAIFLGLALSSRVTYVVIPPLVFAWLLQNRGLRTALRSVAVSVAVAAAVTVPFYLYDPAHFTPLHVTGKLSFLPPTVQHGAAVLLPTAALLIACLGFFRRLTVPDLYCYAGLATAAILVPPALMLLCVRGFSPDGLGLLEYASPAAIYLGLWAFCRFEELHLLKPDPAPDAAQAA